MAFILQGITSMRATPGTLILHKAKEIVLQDNENINCKIRRLGRREYKVCSITGTALQSHLIIQLYDLIKKHFPKYKININKNSLLINSNNKGNLWYALGLAVADGALLSQNKVLFSTTQSCLLDALFSTVPSFSLSISRYFVSLRTGTLSPVVNVYISWSDLGNLLWKIKRTRDIEFLIKNIFNNNILEKFLAGIIDGDGLPDRDNLRISTSRKDILFKIIERLFEGEISYDSRRFIIRIKTRKLRELLDLESLASNLFCKDKKNKILSIYRKRRRFEPDLALDEIKPYIDKNLISLLENHNILFRFKLRLHRNYRYLYITYNRQNKERILNEIKSLVDMLKEVLNVDISKSIKLGKREIVVYNQKVVTLLLYLREIAKSSGSSIQEN